MKTVLVTAALLLATTSASARCLQCDQLIESKPYTSPSYDNSYRSSQPITIQRDYGSSPYYGSVERDGSFNAYSPSSPGRIYGTVDSNGYGSAYNGSTGQWIQISPR